MADSGLRVGEALDRHGKLLWHALGAKTIELIHEQSTSTRCATTSKRSCSTQTY